MTAHIFILGFVQGVGFRRFVKGKAVRLGLKGWVKNLPDGRVEVTVEGEKGIIEKLVKDLEKGSFFADVKSVVIDWDDTEEKFEGFEILHG